MNRITNRLLTLPLKPWFKAPDPWTLGSNDEKAISTWTSLINYGLAISFIFLFIFLIRAAYTLMMSSGNAQKRETARQRMVTALIAIALIGGFSLIVNLAYRMTY